MTKKWRSGARRIALCLICAWVGWIQPAIGANFWVYVGTYTRATSKGVYLFKLDSATGSLTSQGLAAAADDPCFLAIAPGEKYLYACATANNHRTGVIDAFTINPADGTLQLLNQQPSGGNGPTQIAIDPDGNCAAVANYSSGSVSLLPIGIDGKLSPPSSVIQHTGSSVNKSRQQSPHPHSCNFDPSGKFLFVPDLGTDEIAVYHFNDQNLTADSPVPVAPGSGPRHMAFSPDGKFAYLINEMGGTVITYAHSGGTLKQLQTISTLPEKFTAANTAAEVAVHPNGRFVYASNRGNDSIAIFAVDPAAGTLTLIGFQSTLGNGPRMFAIDPTGNFLIAANQNSDNVVLFRIDPQTGKLTATGTTFPVSSPVCVTFLADRN
jgi:6-phosphogluconolactonase